MSTASGTTAAKKAATRARKPQDHLKAAQAEATNEHLMLNFEGKDYSIDPALFSDVEVMEKVADMQEAPYLLPIVVRSLLGDKQWATFKEAMRDKETGRVPGEKLGSFFEALNDLAGNL